MFTKLFKMYDRIYIKLFVQMFTNKKNFFFLSEVRFKNKLVDILVNWLNIKEEQSENDEVKKLVRKICDKLQLIRKVVSF